MRAWMAAIVLVAPALLAGCGDDTAAAPDFSTGAPDMAIDLPAGDLAALPPDMGCFGTPMTHLEILNACTSAQSVDKVPVTPKLNPDGSLPPLP